MNPELHTVYISGPMSGLPQNNYPAFDAAEKRLAALGFNVLNPARNKLIVGEIKDPAKSWQIFMRLAYRDLTFATVIYHLPDSIHSRGAKRESLVIYHLPDSIHSRGAKRESLVAEDMGLAVLTDADLVILEARKLSLSQLTVSHHE